MRRQPTFLAVFVALLIVSGLVCDPAGAALFPGNRIYVAPEGSDLLGNGHISAPYRTINHAVSTLDPSGTDRVVLFLSPGVYRETITLERPGVCLIGAGPHQTVIDARYRGTGILIRDSSDHVIEGLSVIHGDGVVGGGIGLIRSTRVSVRNCRLYANRALGGGGICLLLCDDVSLVNNLVVHNEADARGAGFGGGVALVQAGTAGAGVVLQNNTIVGNNSPSGAGIALLDGGPVRINGNIVVGNAGGEGIAATGTVTGLELAYNNSWGNGGAAYGAGLGVSLPDLTGYNISARQDFVSGAMGSFYVQDGSPAIDGGDPSVKGGPDLPLYGTSLTSHRPDHAPLDQGYRYRHVHHFLDESRRTFTICGYPADAREPMIDDTGEVTLVCRDESTGAVITLPTVAIRNLSRTLYGGAELYSVSPDRFGSQYAQCVIEGVDVVLSSRTGIVDPPLRYSPPPIVSPLQQFRIFERGFRRLFDFDGGGEADANEIENGQDIFNAHDDCKSGCEQFRPSWARPYQLQRHLQILP
jgi:hypothetical protein